MYVGDDILRTLVLLAWRILLSSVEEFNEADGNTLGPSEIFEVLGQVMYGRRSKFNPLWNALLVGGYKDGKRFVY